MIIELQYLICFSIFIALQSLVINGIFAATREGMFLYPVRLFVAKYVSKYWMNPIFGCISCMSSLWGIVTFSSIVIPLFGFHWVEILILIFDIFILCVLNYYFYKKL